MTMERFDTELFIDEVEKRPAIWDIQCEDYSNKIAKNKAWQDLVEIFGINEDSLEKKKLFGVTLQKKWKNIRDAYNKEFKKGKSAPSGSGACKGSKYMYFDRLSFLQKTVENKETTSNIEEAKNEHNEDSDKDQNNFVNAREIRSPPPKKRKKSKSAPEDRLANILEESIQSRDKLQRELQENISNQDDDKLFCLSLYKELKKVPENKRLATKIELLQVIEKGQKLPLPFRITTNQQNMHNTAYLNSQPYSNPQGYFTGYSTIVPAGSPSPSSYTTDDSQSSIVENIYSDIM